MRPELKLVLDEACRLTPEELPRLIGELAEVNAVALLRLTAPAIPNGPDQSLSVAEAAARMGVSKDYLYHHWQEFKFARQEGRKVLFSANGVEAHLRKSR